MVATMTACKLFLWIGIHSLEITGIKVDGWDEKKSVQGYELNGWVRHIFRSKLCEA